jgi:LysR family hydrogen peroxide-inducible transcriptional activator
MITLKQLRYLSALARLRHFGRAAQDCAVTQPALSMQIRELEREIGVDLVERRPGEVAFTEAGREVVERADLILAAARDLVDVARHRGRPLSGALRFGVIPTIAPYVLPRVLPALQQRYPDLTLDMRETQTHVLLDELSRGQLDVVMLALPVDNPDLQAKPLFEDRLLLALPASRAPRGDTPISPRDVDPSELILLEEGHCLRDQALAFCAVSRRDAGMSMSSASATPARLGATSLATVTQMVANGYGVTLLPEIAVDVELRDARVRVVRFSDPAPARLIGLVWRSTSPRVADFLALGEIIVEALGVKQAA